MTDFDVQIRASGFRVLGAREAPDSIALGYLTHDLTSDIGMRLADLGFSCNHGDVELTLIRSDGSRVDPAAEPSKEKAA